MRSTYFFYVVHGVRTITFTVHDLDEDFFSQEMTITLTRL